MQIVPHAEAKKLSQCEPGELVRTRLMGAPVLALVAAAVQGRERYLVVLQGGHMQDLKDHPPGRLPRYTPVRGQLGTVLSYGRNCTLAVDHNGPVEIGGKGNLPNTNGAIARTASSWLLRAQPFQGSAQESTLFDFADGAMAEEPREDVVWFGEWEVFAPPPPQEAVQRPPQPLFAFPAAE